MAEKQAVDMIAYKIPGVQAEEEQLTVWKLTRDRMRRNYGAAVTSILNVQTDAFGEQEGPYNSTIKNVAKFLNRSGVYHIAAIGDHTVRNPMNFEHVVGYTKHQYMHSWLGRAASVAGFRVDPSMVVIGGRVRVSEVVVRQSISARSSIELALCHAAVTSYAENMPIEMDREDLGLKAGEIAVSIINSGYIELA